MLSTFTYSTRLLGTVTRELRLLSIEEAVHFSPGRQRGSTALPIADDWSRERTPTSWCSIPDTIAPGPVTTRFDLPGGAGRLYGEAIGISMSS